MLSISVRFARFFRLQYVIISVVALIVFLWFTLGDQRKQEEEMERRLTSMCYAECMGIFDEDKNTDPSVVGRCMDSCQKKYSEEK